MARSLRAALVGIVILAVALLACKKFKRGGGDDDPTVETASPANTAKPASTAKVDGGASPATTSTLPPVEPLYPPIVPIPSDKTPPLSAKDRKLVEQRDLLKLKIANGKGSDADKKALKELCKQTNDKSCDK